MTSKPLFQNSFILRRSRVAIFGHITQVVTMFIKAVLEDSKKLKALQNTYQNAIYMCISSYSKICCFPRKTDVSRNQRVCHLIQMFLRSSLVLPC